MYAKKFLLIQYNKDFSKLPINVQASRLTLCVKVVVYIHTSYNLFHTVHQVFLNATHLILDVQFNHLCPVAETVCHQF